MAEGESRPEQIWSALVGLRSGVSGGFNSFLAIYLEVKIFFAIFATERFRSQAAPQQ